MKTGLATTSSSFLGLRDTTHDVIQTAVQSGSSGGHELWQWEELCSPSPHPDVHPLKECGKRGKHWRLWQKNCYLCLLLTCSYQYSSIVFHQGALSLIFSGLHVVDALLVILYIPYQVQFQLHLDPPHPISTQSYFISILFPSYLSLFPCPCICFFPFSLTRSSQLCHTDLSFPLTSFSLLGIASSCAPWKTSLKICQLCSALLPLREVLQGTLKRWKFVFLKSCNTVFAVGL